MRFVSKKELMGDEHHGRLSITCSLGSKQTLAVGRIHSEFKSTEENIKPNFDDFR